jgi:hypothetical protein
MEVEHKARGIKTAGFMMSDDNPFHKHSTLLAFAGAVAFVVAIGSLTHWTQLWTPVYVVGGLAALSFLARVFYGFKAAVELDAEPVAPGSAGSARRALFGQGANDRLVDAYNKLREGDPSEFELLAEEEETT